MNWLDITSIKPNINEEVIVTYNDYTYVACLTDNNKWIVLSSLHIVDSSYEYIELNKIKYWMPFPPAKKIFGYV